jgi:four helix bundle protein
MKSGQLWIVKLAEEISRRVALNVAGWPSAEKRHLGDQLKRAVDSIGANIAEGYGRHHVNDSVRFYSIARGSLEESLFWIRRARASGLLHANDASNLSMLLIRLAKSLTAFVEGKKRRHQPQLQSRP